MDILILILLSVVMLRIAYVDYREQYIYNIDVLSGAALSIAYNFCFSAVETSMKGGVCGFAVGYVIFAVTKQVYGVEAFGFGDVLLLGVLGLFFGFPVFFHYFAITIIITGLVASCFLLYDRSAATMAVPMAPIFIGGGFSYVLSGYPTIERFVFKSCYGICYEIYGSIELLLGI